MSISGLAKLPIGCFGYPVDYQYLGPGQTTVYSESTDQVLKKRVVLELKEDPTVYFLTFMRFL
jgi:hypothetical protein